MLSCLVMGSGFSRSSICGGLVVQCFWGYSGFNVALMSDPLKQIMPKIILAGLQIEIAHCFREIFI